MDFFDRTDESDRLRRFLALKEGALACLYGRRRIGKSRLLEEVLKGRTDMTLRRREIPGVRGRWRKVARWWGNGIDRRPMELDVVAESLDGRTLLIGEAKLSLSAREAERTLVELKGKAANLPFAKRHAKTVIRLFVAEGGVPDSISLAWIDGEIKP